jgi:hypothetical protein
LLKLHPPSSTVHLYPCIMGGPIPGISRSGKLTMRKPDIYKEEEKKGRSTPTTYAWGSSPNVLMIFSLSYCI